jgi:hypothetical protein
MLMADLCGASNTHIVTLAERHTRFAMLLKGSAVPHLSAIKATTTISIVRR